MVTLRNLPSQMLQKVLNIDFVSLCRNDFIGVMTIGTFGSLKNFMRPVRVQECLGRSCSTFPSFMVK